MHPLKIRGSIFKKSIIINLHPHKIWGMIKYTSYFEKNVKKEITLRNFLSYIGSDLCPQKKFLQ